MLTYLQFMTRRFASGARSPGSLLARSSAAGQEGPLQRMLRNTLWLLGSKGSNSVLGVAQEVLIARALGVEHYGLLGVAITFVSVTNRLTAFRMNEFVVKFVSESEAEKRPERTAALVKLALLAEAAMSLPAFVLTLLLASLGARWFLRSPDSASLIVVYSFVILGNAVLESSQGILQVFGRFRRQSILATTGRLISLVAVAAAVGLSGRLWPILVALLVGNLATSALLLDAALREVRVRLGASWWRVPLGRLRNRRRAIWRFCLSTNVSSTLSLVTRDADLLWLGLLRGAAAAGHFKIASTLLSAAMLPIKSLVRTSYVELSHATARRAWPTVRSLLRRLTWIAGAYAAAVAGVLVLAGRQLIGLLYGEPFLPATAALHLLLIGAGFSAIFFWSRPALLALDRPGYALKVNGLVASLKLLAVYPVVTRYGIAGNAALLSALYLIGVSLSVRKVHSELSAREAGTA